jgi:hypothetical protein
MSTEDITKAELIERVEQLEQHQEELRAEQNQVLSLFQQLKAGRISRRAFMTAVAAVGGVGYLAGTAQADPEWTNATGKIGEEAKPLNNGWVRNFYTESLSTADAASDPSSNGGIQRNGSDIKAYSGGAVRNLSNIGPGGVWEEDGNSPFTGSGSGEYQFSLSDTYDMWMFIADVRNTSASGAVKVRVNGDVYNNYDYYELDGTKSTDVNAFVGLAGHSSGSDDIKSIFYISGRWGNNCTATSIGLGNDYFNGTMAHSGRNTDVSSPLSSVSIYMGTGSDTFDITFRALGKDI